MIIRFISILNCHHRKNLMHIAMPSIIVNEMILADMTCRL